MGIADGDLYSVPDSTSMEITHGSHVASTTPNKHPSIHGLSLRDASWARPSHCSLCDVAQDNEMLQILASISTLFWGPLGDIHHKRQRALHRSQMTETQLCHVSLEEVNKVCYSGTRWPAKIQESRRHMMTV